MTLRDLLRESLEIDDEDVWENERTPTPVRCFAVGLHSMGLSVREVEAVWNWKEKLAETQLDPRRRRRRGSPSTRSKSLLTVRNSGSTPRLI